MGGLSDVGEKGRKEVNILRRREGWSEEEPLYCGGARLARKFTGAVCGLVLFWKVRAGVYNIT